MEDSEVEGTIRQDNPMKKEIGLRIGNLRHSASTAHSLHSLLLRVIQMFVVDVGIHVMDGGAAILADAPVFFFVEVPCLWLIRENDLGANDRSFSDAGVDALDIGLLVSLGLQ